MMKELLSVKNLETIKQEYYNNKNSFLCEKYGCCEVKLRKFLKKNDVELKKKSQSTKNDDFFENINSEEKAYFLGFICADGSINNKKSKLSITLNIVDIEILKYLKNVLKTTAPVAQRMYIDKRNNTEIYNCSIQIYSKKLVQDLKLLGVDQNKSNKLQLPRINKNLIKHFLRGMFDGDGHIGKQTTLVSTKECHDDIIEFLKENNINVENYRAVINKEKNVHLIYFGKDRIKFLNLLYKNSNVFLKRKFEAYLNETNRHDNEIMQTNIHQPILIINENKFFYTQKECIEYQKISYKQFIKNLNNGCYKKYNKIMIKTKRNGEKIIMEIL